MSLYSKISVVFTIFLLKFEMHNLISVFLIVLTWCEHLSCFYILFPICSLAISDYKNAENLQHEGSNNRRVQEGLSKAQKLLKQSQKRDYYKILGVKRYYYAFYDTV